MSTNFQALIPAKPLFNEQGVLQSNLYDDIYYAGSQPLEQSRELFLKGNNLPYRWQNRPVFTIFETGFGLGLNFLSTWQAWKQDSQASSRLHFVSVEAHPFTATDYAQLLRSLPVAIQPMAKQLLAAWPELLPGIHRLEFEQGRLTLTLAFGRIESMMKQFELGFDACFLDGFSPRVNPDMWTPQVFGQLARLANTGASLATWCSAGQVRRDLQNAGFVIERHPGFSGKRHQIRGHLRPGMGKKRGFFVKPASIAIVGAGFAGAAIAHALSLRGHEVHVFDPALSCGLAGTHTGHRAAVLAPYLSRDYDIRSRLSQAALLLAHRRWSTLFMPKPASAGAFQCVRPEQAEAWKQTLARFQFPETWVRWLNASQAQSFAGISREVEGLGYGYARLIQPETFLTQLLQSPGVIHHSKSISQFLQHDKKWQLLDTSGQLCASVDTVILATAGQTRRILNTIVNKNKLGRLESLHEIAGQLSYFDAYPGTLKSMVLGEGLCFSDEKKRLIGGSTYERNTSLSIITCLGHHNIGNKVAVLLGVEPSRLNASSYSWQDGWSAWRAFVTDRLPVIGPVSGQQGLWLACGFGSRGLAWSALAGELIAASLNNEPLPIERELYKKLMP